MLSKTVFGCATATLVAGLVIDGTRGTAEARHRRCCYNYSYACCNGWSGWAGGYAEQPNACVQAYNAGGYGQSGQFENAPPPVPAPGAGGQYGTGYRGIYDPGYAPYGGTYRGGVQTFDPNVPPPPPTQGGVNVQGQFDSRSRTNIDTRTNPNTSTDPNLRTAPNTQVNPRSGVNSRTDAQSNTDANSDIRTDAPRAPERPQRPAVPQEPGTPATPTPPQP
jgi:hypothetical protein